MRNAEGIETCAVTLETLTGSLVPAFEAAGLREEEATRIVDALLDAELVAVPTHGLLRVPWYLDALRRGSIRPCPPLVIERSAPAVSLIDGHGAYGYLPTWTAVRTGVAAATQSGIGCVGVRRIAEFGRAGYYAKAAATAGMVAVVCQNTLPLIAPPGAVVATHGNNPLAFAGPGADGPLFDAAFTRRSAGELLRRSLIGLSIPSEWGYVDERGKATIDPRRAFSSPQQAVGGAKGFGLAVLVDLLAGVLTSAASGPAVRAGVAEVGAMVIVLDPAAFGTTANVVAAQLARGAESVRAAGGRWPGDRGAAARASAMRRGARDIPVPVVKALEEAIGDTL